MGKPTKSVKDKLLTKLVKLKDLPKVRVTSRQVSVEGKILFKYNEKEISYTKTRYFPSMKEDVIEEDFTVTILLDHLTLNIVAGQIQNPPKSSKRILDFIRSLESQVTSIVIGGNKNKIEGNKFYITYELYITFVAINSEEGKEKAIRVRNRLNPFLQEYFGLETIESSSHRDYSLLMSELIASNEFTQQDILNLTNQLEVGEVNNVVIEKQINKQAEWLLDSMQSIIDEPNLSTPKAKDLGKHFFGFSKNSISGPEDLMEKILTVYGQNIIFGVPALLNVDGFVSSSTGLPKSQFDLLLVTNLSDIEIVELKRPDDYLMEYDANRGKFYMSKSLGTAAAQCERYITAIYKENDSELKIKGKTIREYLQSELEGTINLSICRPKALIIMGTIHGRAKKYEDLSLKTKARITKNSYENNLDKAYKELKSTFRNIDITTYSELIDSARLRLQVEEGRV